MCEKNRPLSPSLDSPKTLACNPRSFWIISHSRSSKERRRSWLAGSTWIFWMCFSRLETKTGMASPMRTSRQRSTPSYSKVVHQLFSIFGVLFCGVPPVCYEFYSGHLHGSWFVPYEMHGAKSLGISVNHSIFVGFSSHKTQSTSQHAHANYGTHCCQWECSHRLQATSKGLHANLLTRPLETPRPV